MQRPMAIRPLKSHRLPAGPCDTERTAVRAEGNIGTYNYWVLDRQILRAAAELRSELGSQTGGCWVVLGAAGWCWVVLRDAGA